jgi:hypothetical protein
MPKVSWIIPVLEIMTAPNETLRTILPIAGWGDGQAADVVFTGGADPVLPTPFCIGAAGAAALACRISPGSSGSTIKVRR